MRPAQFLMFLLIGLTAACSPIRTSTEIDAELIGYPPPDQETLLPTTEIGGGPDTPSAAYPPPSSDAPDEVSGTDGRKADYPKTIIVFSFSISQRHRENYD